ncbi:hypothetical protein DENSPDRAFT_818530 [Dentipellis sp. KUC8613]|nr:hypothetical protein DENSPDRAFT_818530 [Dentipellis sp. KUC8613]
MKEDFSNQPCYMSRLPVELLRKIFLIPHAKCYYSRPVIDHDSQRHPIYVSHVSRQWRAVAVQTPALWVILHANPATVRSDRLCAFLERSASCPLTISIYTDGPDQSDLIRLGELYLSLLSRLQPHATRWRVLEIASTHEEIQDQVLDFLGHITAPALRRFRVRGNININVDADPLPLPFHGDMTKLEDLYLSHVQLSWTDCRLQSLTSLALIGYPEISLSELLDFLSSCPGLLNLTLDLLSFDHPDDETRVVTLPVLERFVFHISIRFIHYVWNRISLPRLRSLTLYPAGRDHRPALELLTLPHHAMPTSPPPSWSLTSLGLWPRSEVSGFTCTLFHELPNLRVLFLCPNDRVASCSSLQDLTMHCKSEFLPPAAHAVPALVLPQLTTLMLAEGRISEGPIKCVSWDLLQTAVTQRREAGVPLKKLFIEYEQAWVRNPPEEASWLLENVDVFGMMPKHWELQEMNIEYPEDWDAVEAEQAGTWAFERLCERLGFILFKPKRRLSASSVDVE